MNALPQSGVSLPALTLAMELSVKAGCDIRREKPDCESLEPQAEAGQRADLCKCGKLLLQHTEAILLGLERSALNSLWHLNT